MSILLVFLLFGCKTSQNGEDYYYECISDQGYYLLSEPNNSAIHDVYIAPGAIYYTKSSPRKKYQKFQVGTHIGYLYRPKFTKRYRSFYKIIPATVAIDQDEKLFKGTHGKLYYIYNPASIQTSQRAQNTYSNPGGTVNVKGYYRKDGTYVHPHTRSAPRRH